MRSLVLGDALRTLGVQRTPLGRRRVIVRVQIPFLALFVLVLVAILAAGIDADVRAVVLACLLFEMLFTIASLLVAWERWAELAGIVIAGVDLIAITIVSVPLIATYPRIGFIQLLPVVILAYSFGLAGLVVAVVGSFAVSILPLFLAGVVPADAHDWIQALLAPLTISVAAGAVHLFSVLLQRTQVRLRESRVLSEQIAEAADDERAVIMTVLDTMDVGTAYVRPDNTMAFTNTAFRGLVEKSAVDPETLAGTLVFDTDRRTPVPPEHQMMAQAARGEYFDSRLYWVGEPGDQRAILVSARPVFGHDESNIGSAFVSKDVTELTDAIRAREDFLAGISHELRTPLTSIIGYLEVIEDEIDVEAAGIARELGIIQRNANQLMMRIGDLLHTTDESVSLRQGPAEIPRIVEQAVDAIRFRAENSGVFIDLSSAPPFVATVDPGRLAQVLDNLLTNAIKFTDRGGRVSVSISTDEASYRITVADTGSGMSDTEIGRIFERFYRAESVRGGSIAGIGLGLSIVRSIVRAHGGRVAVDSTPGVGSTFTVELPRGI